MKILLQAENICYSYDDGKKVLDGVNFCVSGGESTALVGSNGAGKSTLLQIIAGVLTPGSGRLFFGGEPVVKRIFKHLRGKIGLVFQNPDHQLFCGSVYEDVVFGPLNLGLSREEADARAESSLAELGISELRNRPPYRLSAGEKRLAAIASVLSMQPELLLFDEPTAELDPRARRNLIPLINRLPQAKIIATHDLDFAARVCPKAMILCGGEVAASGESAALLTNGPLLESMGL